MSARATFLFASTGKPAQDVLVGARSLRDGSETGFTPPRIFDGTPNVGSPDEEGFLEVPLDFELTSCPPALTLPLPDRVEFLFIVGDCESSTIVEINDTTAASSLVDQGGSREQFIELKNPILVPPCEQ